MSVVLRCPTCGTTQGHAGECEACSEGEVRYFCTNHDEGIWLDGPVCSRCGAKFGDPPRKPPSADGRAYRRGRPGHPTSDRRHAARAPERPSEPDFGRRPPRRPELEEPAEPEVLPRTPSLGELLEDITEERARARGALRSRGGAVGGAAGSSSWVPARGVSRQDRGPGVPVDRRRHCLFVLVVWGLRH